MSPEAWTFFTGISVAQLSLFGLLGKTLVDVRSQKKTLEESPAMNGVPNKTLVAVERLEAIMIKHLEDHSDLRSKT